MPKHKQIVARTEFASRAYVAESKGGESSLIINDPSVIYFYYDGHLDGYNSAEDLDTHIFCHQDNISGLLPKYVGWNQYNNFEGKSRDEVCSKKTEILSQFFSDPKYLLSDVGDFSRPSEGHVVRSKVRVMTGCNNNFAMTANNHFFRLMIVQKTDDCINRGNTEKCDVAIMGAEFISDDKLNVMQDFSSLSLFQFDLSPTANQKRYSRFLYLSPLINTKVTFCDNFLNLDPSVRDVSIRVCTKGFDILQFSDKDLANPLEVSRVPLTSLTFTSKAVSSMYQIMKLLPGVSAKIYEYLDLVTAGSNSIYQLHFLKTCGSHSVISHFNSDERMKEMSRIALLQSKALEKSSGPTSFKNSDAYVRDMLSSTLKEQDDVLDLFSNLAYFRANKFFADNSVSLNPVAGKDMLASLSSYVTRGIKTSRHNDDASAQLAVNSMRETLFVRDLLTRLPQSKVANRFFKSLAHQWNDALTHLCNNLMYKHHYAGEFRVIYGQLKALSDQRHSAVLMEKIVCYYDERADASCFVFYVNVEKDCIKYKTGKGVGEGVLSTYRIKYIFIPLSLEDEPSKFYLDYDTNFTGSVYLCENPEVQGLLEKVSSHNENDYNNSFKKLMVIMGDNIETRLLGNYKKERGTLSVISTKSIRRCETKEFRDCQKHIHCIGVMDASSLLMDPVFHCAFPDFNAYLVKQGDFACNSLKFGDGICPMKMVHMPRHGGCEIFVTAAMNIIIVPSLGYTSETIIT